MVNINKKRVADHEFVAVFKTQRVKVFGKSQAEATQRAVEYFKPKKAEKHLVTVELFHQSFEAEVVEAE